MSNPAPRSWEPIISAADEVIDLAYAVAVMFLAAQAKSAHQAVRAIVPTPPTPESPPGKPAMRVGRDPRADRGLW